MEKKRSKGVMVFGWILILMVINVPLCLRQLFSEGYFNEVFNRVLSSGLMLTVLQYKLMLLWRVVVAILQVVAGILILRLNELGRKIILWISCIVLFGVIPFFIVLIVINKYSLLRIMMEMILPVLINGVIIYFFTRPKVKEQFR